MSHSKIQRAAYLLPQMISIKGGSFEIGSNDGYDNEKPPTLITLPDFEMAKYPVSNEAFLCFLNDYESDTVQEGPHQGQRIIKEHRWSMQKGDAGWWVDEKYKRHPVVNVTWCGANAYAAWLSQASGKQFRLPSESEWEYAARGGQQSKGFQYAGSHNIKEVAWYDKNSAGQPMPVGLKLGNELGLHDMSGNVFEWCADHCADNYHDIPKDGKPYINSENLEKDYFTAVVRGGSWFDVDYLCRVSFRVNWFSNFRYFLIGFRLCGFSP